MTHINNWVNTESVEMYRKLAIKVLSRDYLDKADYSEGFKEVTDLLQEALNRAYYWK